MKGSPDMKKAHRFALLAVLALSVTAISPSHAQSGGMKGMDMKDMDMKGIDMSKDKKSEGKTHKGVGTVKKVDPIGGKVTLAHGPIQSLKWPAMTMTFGVKDKALLGKFSQDKKVEFEFVQQGSDYVITSAK
jgi:Cu(I)/Ag(I) efflux system protein CusF